jgi:CRISPR-associated endoribonuclease Cas6
MRLKLKLNAKPNGTISANYAYALQAVIYKVLEQADPVFSQWLHEHGYEVSGRKFKLFTFDLLRGEFRINSEKRTISFPTGNIEWVVSFCVEETLEKFVMGLFHRQRLQVATPGGRIDFDVQSVEVLPTPVFSETMRFRAKMPIFIQEKRDDQTQATYLSPKDNNYEKLFFGNLERKFQAAKRKTFKHPSSDCLLRLLSSPKSRKFDVLKKELDKPIEVRGFIFDFEITAPVKWLRIGYEAGFGGKNSSGFGFCEVLK